jgi:hypothetical protein
MTVEAQPFKRFQLRDRANFITYVGTELALLKKEWKILLPCVIMQCTAFGDCVKSYAVCMRG